MIDLRRTPFVWLSAVLLAACGARMPNGKGQANDLYAKTFAGRSACAPAQAAARPFIIDWDATDQSSFQAQAQSDVVVVRYHDCALEVLTECRADDMKGSFGSYAAIQWTSGGLESIDIADEDDLYAKLPLGVASLGGRVESGEKFHMEYFVSGTRTATREHLYASELASNPACAGATHFVHQYNLGAFALAAQSKLHAAIDGSYFGFGAGGGKTSETTTDKKGGDLAACTEDSAKEVDDCKVPIRLTLRAISEGDPPEVAESKAPETDLALNLAGKLKAETDAQKKAEERFEAAKSKLNAKDGKGCLAELDAHDKLDPRPAAQSTSAKGSYFAMVRSQCLMLSGKCDAGKALLRKVYSASLPTDTSPEEIDRTTDAMAAKFCQGKVSDRDALIRARTELIGSSYSSKTLDGATCKKDIAIIDTLRFKVKPTGADDTMIQDSERVLWQSGSRCLAKAGECSAALANYDRMYVEVCQLQAKQNAAAAAAYGMPTAKCAPMPPASLQVSFATQIAPGTPCAGKTP